jgi:hypothetical protein
MSDGRRAQHAIFQWCVILADRVQMWMAMARTWVAIWLGCHGTWTNAPGLV